MNKEIEKILDEMDLIVNHNKVPIYFTQNDVKLLLDYITSLKQQLNEYITPVNRKMTDIEVVRLNLVDMIRRGNKLEQRIFKALEDIEKLTNGDYEEVNGDSAKYYHIPKDCCIERLEVIKKDLSGDDNK